MGSGIRATLSGSGLAPGRFSPVIDNYSTNSLPKASDFFANSASFMKFSSNSAAALVGLASQSAKAGQKSQVVSCRPETRSPASGPWACLTAHFGCRATITSNSHYVIARSGAACPVHSATLRDAAQSDVEGTKQSPGGCGDCSPALPGKRPPGLCAAQAQVSPREKRPGLAMTPQTENRCTITPVLDKTFHVM